MPSNLEQLKSIMGNEPLYKKLRDEAKQTVSKWQKSGLLEGIDNDFEKSGMAMLLENQAKQLIEEASTTGTTANAEQWSGVALPLVRKVFGEIAAKEFVSVQPMSLPSGLVFYLDFQYGTAQPGRTAGDSVYGNTTASAVSQFDQTGLYGAGQFSYSINETSSAVTTPVAGTTSVTASWLDVGFSSTLSASIASGNIKKISIPSADVPSADLVGVRAFVPSGSALLEYFPEFTVVAGTNINFLVSASAAAPSGVVVTYQRQPADISRGDFEDTSNQTDANTDIGIPELNLAMNSVTIVAKTRKLKAIWSPEFAQDLNAYHSVDAEAEVTSMLSEYISMEIDLEILDMLLQNALTTEYWSTTINETWNSDTNAFVTGPTGSFFNQGQWFQTLGTKVQKVSNRIHQLTMRGGANFLVTSPELSTILESIPGYAADTNGDKMKYAMGVQKIGAINNRFTVYKNPYMVENTILIGFRGTQFLETGAVYAPYIPLIMTPLVYDPNNFTPRKGVLTRYAKKMVRPEFYGKIVVKNSGNF